MKTLEGTVQNGGIIFSEPLELPDGAAVRVNIEEKKESGKPLNSDFEKQPFFGMWSDRDDMSDSAEWVRKEREKWQRTRQD